MKTLKRINPVQIFIHAVAIYCLGIGSSILAALLDIEGLELLHQFRTGGMMRGENSEKISRLIIITGIGMVAGIGTGFILSLVLSIRRQWLWLNSLLAVLLNFGFLMLMLNVKIQFGNVLWFLAKLLNLSAVPSYAITGLFWTSIAFLLLFSPVCKKAISGRKSEEKEIVFQFENESERTQFIDKI
jgi:hypothetical protein